MDSAGCSPNRSSRGPGSNTGRHPGHCDRGYGIQYQNRNEYHSSGLKDPPKEDDSTPVNNNIENRYYASRDHDITNRWNKDKNSGKFRQVHDNFKNGSQYNYTQQHSYTNNSGFICCHGLIDETSTSKANKATTRMDSFDVIINVSVPSNNDTSMTGVVVESVANDNQTTLSSLCNETFEQESILTGTTGNKFVILKQLTLSKGSVLTSETPA